MTVSGRWVAALLALGAIGFGCVRRTAYVYEIPEAFRGWIRIDFDIADCAPLGTDVRIVKVPTSGRLCTSDKIEEGGARDVFYLVGAERREVKENDPLGGLVWGRSFGNELTPGKDPRPYMTMFVGTRKEFESAAALRP